MSSASKSRSQRSGVSAGKSVPNSTFSLQDRVRLAHELRREVLRRPAGQVDPHVRLVAGDRQRLVLPRHRRVGHDHLHVREVRGDLVEVHRVGVLEQDPTAARQPGADRGLAGVEHRRQLVLGDHLVERVRQPVVREEALQARVELEAADVVLVDQPPRLAPPRRSGAGRCSRTGSGRLPRRRQLEDLVVGHRSAPAHVSTMKQTAAMLRSR